MTDDATTQRLIDNFGEENFIVRCFLLILFSM